VVAARLVQHGATLIDADVLAREAVAPGTPGLAAIVERWGHEILQLDGTLDRPRLRHIVFGDSDERAALDAIVHPEVERLRTLRVEEARARGDQVVVCDIPLLFEKSLQDRFDAVLFVEAPESVRFERLMTRRTLTAAVAQAMMSAQLPSAEKRQRATWVIDNTGTMEELQRQVDALWPSLVSIASGSAPLPTPRHAP
jgi:dephospho-CoA kinase